MGAAGIVFSEGKFGQIDELVRKRTEASIPFGGRYRLIDFALSNMVNAGVVQVAVVTKRNYQSLMDHIGSGKDWDLSRKNGGVSIFPPFGNYKNGTVYANQIEALQGIIGFISKCQEENLIITECSSVNVVDYSEALALHEKNSADITIIGKKQKNEFVNPHLVATLDKNGQVKSASMAYKTDGFTGIDAFIIKRQLLENLLGEASIHGYTSIEQEIIINNVASLRIFGYEYQGTLLPIDSMQHYYEYNMALLDEAVRRSVLEVLPIYTKTRDSAPTRFGLDAHVENSLIADGCMIEGTVINSIIFRGVKIAKGTVVENCILMQDTVVMNNVKLKAVITDKNVTIRDRQELVGCAQLPYFVGKGMMI